MSVAQPHKGGKVSNCVCGESGLWNERLSWRQGVWLQYFAIRISLAERKAQTSLTAGATSDLGTLIRWLWHFTVWLTGKSCPVLERALLSYNSLLAAWFLWPDTGEVVVTCGPCLRIQEPGDLPLERAKKLLAQSQSERLCNACFIKDFWQNLRQVQLSQKHHTFRHAL